MALKSTTNVQGAEMSRAVAPQQRDGERKLQELVALLATVTSIDAVRRRGR
jgi:aminoglycoside phosphotransferase (APT) family kinase protein